MSGNQETIDQQDKRRIAVVAFHGVADQKQAIAGMLPSLRDYACGATFHLYLQNSAAESAKKIAN